MLLQPLWHAGRISGYFQSENVQLDSVQLPDWMSWSGYQQLVILHVGWLSTLKTHALLFFFNINFTRWVENLICYAAILKLVFFKFLFIPLKCSVTLSKTDCDASSTKRENLGGAVCRLRKRPATLTLIMQLSYTALLNPNYIWPLVCRWGEIGIFLNNCNSSSSSHSRNFLLVTSS